MNDYECGWWIDATVDNIAVAIEKVLNLSDEDKDRLGTNGKKLIANKYAADKVAEMMVTLYKWLMGECDKPEFVYTL